MNEILKYIDEKNLGTYYLNKSFRELTTLKIGGKIKLYYLPNTIDDFLSFYRYIIDKDIPLFIIGAGSNILASDDDYEGIVVSFKNLDIQFARVGNKATIFAGCKIISFVMKMAKLNLGGIEFLAGIPGTLGGIVTMNAGSFGNTVADILESALCIDCDGNIKNYSKEELMFDYRSSLVRMKDLIVLSANIFLVSKQSNEINKEIKRLKKLREKTQPLKSKNAGCAFKNNKSHSAWYLIDQVGLRGTNVNGAMISNKHSNFLINENNASSKDMLELIRLVKKKVKNKYGIDLITEWVLLNFKENLRL